MKATFDLPAELLREMKIRAAQDGKKLKDVAAEFLVQGMANSGRGQQSKALKPRIVVRKNGLPVVQCATDAPAKSMTAAELLALEHAILAQEDLPRN